MASTNEFVHAFETWTEIFMHHSMRAFFRYAKERGLSMSQIGALFQIQRKRALSVSDVGDHLGVTNPAASQMLDRLVQQNLVTRTEDPEDRRVKKLVLTEYGQEIVQASVTSREQWLERLAERMSPEEQQQVVAALEILVEKTRQIEASVQNDR